MYRSPSSSKGFTLVELLVVLAIIGILSSIVTVSFGQARAQARDDVRKSDIRQLQLAVEQYKAQNGRYPTAGCSVSPWGGANPVWAGDSVFTTAHPWIRGNCSDYIQGLVPGYINELPTEVQTNWVGRGYIYTVSADGQDYKILAHHNVEAKMINTSGSNGGYGEPFARFSEPCPGPNHASGFPPGEVDVYAAFSHGARCW